MIQNLTAASLDSGDFVHELAHDHLEAGRESPDGLRLMRILVKAGVPWNKKPSFEKLIAFLDFLFKKNPGTSLSSSNFQRPTMEIEEKGEIESGTSKM